VDAARLKQIDIFASLPDDELEWLASQAAELSLEEGDALIRKGTWSYEMVAIEEGTVEVHRHDETVATLGTGDVVGETGVLRRALHNADVVATTPVRALRFTQNDVKRIRESIPDFEQRLEALLDEREA